MNNELVSIIIPCYNSEKTIERAVYSSINQTYSNIEIICIDDGSTDRTVQILDRLAQEHGNLIVLVNKRNKGPSYSRNRGVSEASGDLIAFLDADDYWHTKKLEIQIKLMKDNNYNFISGCKKLNLQEKSPFQDSNIKVKKISFNKLLFKNYFVTSSVVMEHRLFIPFDENQRYSEDYKSWLEISLNPKTKCGLITFPFLNGSIKRPYGESGLSSKLWQMEKNELKNYWVLLKKGHILALVAMPLSFLKYIKRTFITHLKL